MLQENAPDLSIRGEVQRDVGGDYGCVVVVDVVVVDVPSVSVDGVMLVSVVGVEYEVSVEDDVVIVVSLLDVEVV